MNRRGTKKNIRRNEQKEVYGCNDKGTRKPNNNEE